MLGGWVKAQGGDKEPDALTREDVDRLGSVVWSIKQPLH